MDIVLFIIGSFYLRKKALEKALDPSSWIWKFIGLGILFEVMGALTSWVMTKGNWTMMGLFGFTCAFGAFLLVKYQLDKVQPPEKKEHHWMDNIIDRDMD
jgi:hypothetical protein